MKTGLSVLSCWNNTIFIKVSIIKIESHRLGDVNLIVNLIQTWLQEISIFCSSTAREIKNSAAGAPFVRAREKTERGRERERWIKIFLARRGWGESVEGKLNSDGPVTGRTARARKKVKNYFDFLDSALSILRAVQITSKRLFFRRGPEGERRGHFFFSFLLQECTKEL